MEEEEPCGQSNNLSLKRIESLKNTDSKLKERENQSPELKQNSKANDTNKRKLVRENYT